MLALWSLVLLSFLKPALTSASSWFTYCWSLAWRILSIILLVVRWVHLCGSLSNLWHCLSLGFPYISNKLKKKKVKIEAIYMHVLERSHICLVTEASQLISVSHRQSHSGHNSANLNDTPVMTTSTQNISLNSLSLSMISAQSQGWGVPIW